MKYLDTGVRDPATTLYCWFDSVLPTATYFGCQTGYFTYDGVFPHEAQFLDLLKRSGSMRLVVGANESGVRRIDLEDVLDLFSRGPSSATTSLVVVAADDLLMHPKTYYVEQSDGTVHALVGSANLTHPGLVRNIESALAIDSVNDPGAPFGEIRDAIEKWHQGTSRNAFRVDRSTLTQLVSDGLVDRPPRTPPAVSPSARRTRAKKFPALGAILTAPRKKRPVTRSGRASPRRRGPAAPPGTLPSLPGGSVGVIKRLTPLDVKGFHGGTGTFYIALPVDLRPHLPMEPAGKNDAPRVDVNVEARLDSVPAEVIRSGASPTNITHEGAGARGSSHRDLRLNYLTPIRRGIQQVASDNAVPVPTADDLVAIEFLDGVSVRLTFINDPKSVSDLSPLLDQRGNTWGWLPARIVAPWDSDLDA